MNNDTERALLKAISANPSELTPKLAYVDLLEEWGDKRAALLRTFVLSLQEPSKAKHRKLLHKLRKGLDPLWLAAIGDTQVRLQNVAKVLNQRQYEEYEGHFERIKSYCGPHLDDLQLRCPDSTIGIHVSEDLLLDLEVDVDATDPRLTSISDGVLKQVGEQGEDVRGLFADSQIAPATCSLYLWTLSAANGTATIALDPYVNGKGEFTNLKRFATNLRNEDGTCIICSDAIGNGYDEAGLLAKLLNKSPAIEELVIPSSPNHEFFSAGVRPLKILRLRAGYDTQDFILNLSRSNCFPELAELEYDERTLYGEPGELVVPESRVTPFEHFVELFRSPALASVQRVKLFALHLTSS